MIVRPLDKGVQLKTFFYTSIKTYVVGAQCDDSFEHAQCMLKLIGKKISTFLRSLFLVYLDL